MSLWNKKKKNTDEQAYIEYVLGEITRAVKQNKKMAQVKVESDKELDWLDRFATSRSYEIAPAITVNGETYYAIWGWL